MTMEAQIAEAKKNFCALVDRAERGETITILRHGRPAAQLIPAPRRKSPRPVAKADPALYKGINLEEPIMDPIE